MRLEGELDGLKDKIKLAQEQAELAIKADRDDLAQAALEKRGSELENKKEELIAINKAADAQLIVKEIMTEVSVLMNSFLLKEIGLMGPTG